jgi:methylated-DNA-[protein]-cysteine S-methyltransferase
MIYVHKMMKTPVGTLKLVGSEAGLAAILWENDDPRRVPIEAAHEAEHHPVLVEAEEQLNEYFAGRRRVFSVKLDFTGTTFQKKVWQALLDIPFGETRTYGELARQIGSPAAVRAVGAANGKNPISIIGPCHRVIGASGKLTGFAGGLHVKAMLLRFEGEVVGEKAIDMATVDR